MSRRGASLPKRKREAKRQEKRDQKRRRREQRRGQARSMAGGGGWPRIVNPTFRDLPLPVGFVGPGLGPRPVTPRPGTGRCDGDLRGLWWPEADGWALAFDLAIQPGDGKLVATGRLRSGLRHSEIPRLVGPYFAWTELATRSWHPGSPARACIAPRGGVVEARVIQDCRRREPRKEDSSP